MTQIQFSRRKFFKTSLTLTASLAVPTSVLESVLDRLTPEVPIYTGPVTMTTFAEMLNRYMPYELLAEEIQRKDTLFANLGSGPVFWGEVFVPFSCQKLA